MSSGFTVRAEAPSDAEAIRRVIDLAFAEMPYSDGDEGELVEVLRSRNALSVSLVAEQDGVVIGQVAFSPAHAPGAAPGWFALGPVGVLPEHQGRGIGSALVRAGLEAILGRGACGCILVGNPAYYERFGFVCAPGNAPPGQPAEYFMIRRLRGEVPAGPIRFHEAFDTAASHST